MMKANAEIGQIPEEVWREFIFAYLGFKKSIKLRQINKDLDFIIQDNVTWQIKFIPAFVSFSRFLLRCLSFSSPEGISHSELCQKST